MDLPRTLETAFGSRENFHAQVVSSGLRIVAFNSSFQMLNDTDWRPVAELAKWAGAAGVPHIRVFDGGGQGQGSEPGSRAVIVDRLIEWGEIKQELGLCGDLIIETHTSLTRVEDCLRLGEECRRAGVELKLLWDAFHTWKCEGHHMERSWRQLRPFVRHVHVKDAKLPDYGFVLPGEGDAPMKELIDVLEADGFEGPVSLEWEKYWHPHLPPLEAAIDSAIRHGWFPTD